MIFLEDFQKIDLRVATIIKAEPIPQTDKLLKLTIDLGKEKRTLVAGIAKHYQPEELEGKQIIVVANLKPAVIRDVESQGMLLAASSSDKLSLLVPDKKIANGSKVS